MKFSLGEEELSGCDDANIPCNIFITEVTEDDLEDLMGELQGRDDVPEGWKPKWKLTADNFMPRKGLWDGANKYVADTKEELTDLVKEHVLPMYKIAFDAITAMSEGKRDSFYYWTKDD